jgi:hypothetical protein
MPVSEVQNREKIKKIKKFSKVIKKFCSQIGVDKKTFFAALGVEKIKVTGHVEN